MELLNELTDEQQLLLLTSRLTLSELEINKIKEIVEKGGVSWFDLFRLAFYHKTATLCWKNLIDNVPQILIPKYLNDTIYSAYVNFKNRNKLYQIEIKNIINELHKVNIACIPVKGAYLIPNLYKNAGVRYCGDADILFKYENLHELEYTLQKLDYVKGFYDYQKDMILPASRAVELKYKMMSNLHPYVKKSNENETLLYYKFDFRHALDDSLNRDSVNEIINSYIKLGYVKNEHYLIHLCIHFYSEAKNSISIYLYKDMNLIKLCDIREYILQFMNEKSITDFIEFSKKHHYKKQVYFTMVLLSYLYNDGYEKKIVDKLEIEDMDVIETFGESTENEQYKFKKTLYERIFSCNNLDELSSKPKFAKIIL